MALLLDAGLVIAGPFETEVNGCSLVGKGRWRRSAVKRGR